MHMNAWVAGMSIALIVGVMLLFDVLVCVAEMGVCERGRWRGGSRVLGCWGLERVDGWCVMWCVKGDSDAAC